MFLSEMDKAIVKREVRNTIGHVMIGVPVLLRKWTSYRVLYV